MATGYNPSYASNNSQNIPAYAKLSSTTYSSSPNSSTYGNQTSYTNNYSNNTNGYSNNNQYTSNTYQTQQNLPQSSLGNNYSQPLHNQQSQSSYNQNVSQSYNQNIPQSSVGNNYSQPLHNQQSYNQIPQPSVGSNTYSTSYQNNTINHNNNNNQNFAHQTLPVNNSNIAQYNSSLQPNQQILVRDWYDTYYDSIDSRQLEILKAWFKSVDTDDSGEIDQRELSNMKMPGVGPFTGSILGIDAATQLIKLFDRDGSGTINFKEYAALHCFMDRMNSSFHSADSDNNGLLDSNEIAHAMGQAGFVCSKEVIGLFYAKYNTGNGLNFVQFMRMASDIALIKSKFTWLDKNNDGLLNLDEVLHLCAQIQPKPNVVVFAAASTPKKPQSDQGCCIS